MLSSRQRFRSIFSCLVDEWYFGYFYATFSLYFAKAFFLRDDQNSQLLSTAPVFVVGFLMRRPRSIEVSNE